VLAALELSTLSWARIARVGPLQVCNASKSLTGFLRVLPSIVVVVVVVVVVVIIVFVVLVVSFYQLHRIHLSLQLVCPVTRVASAFRPISYATSSQIDHICAGIYTSIS
jgi:hypothetical protein